MARGTIRTSQACLDCRAGVLGGDLTDAILNNVSCPCRVRRASATREPIGLAGCERTAGVNLMVLWESTGGPPGGYGYSRFCDLFRDSSGSISDDGGSTNRPSYKVFAITPAKKSDRRSRNWGCADAEIFARLGASNNTYAEALDADTSDLIEAHAGRSGSLAGATPGRARFVR